MDGRLGGQPTKQVGRDGDYNPLFDSSPERERDYQPEPTVVRPDDRPAVQPSEEPPEPSRSRRTIRVLACVALAAALLVGIFGAAAYISLQLMSNNIARVPDVFGRIDNNQRPAPLPNRVSFLIMGTDSRQAAARRDDDVMMLARIDIHLDSIGARGSVVLLPRDSWVNIPDRGSNTIAAAYGLGGPSLLVETVEQMTRVRIDHFAIIDFAGFTDVVDAVGGIDVVTANGDGVQLAHGTNHLDGRMALAYVSYGTKDPAEYADRLTRQRNALHALLDKAGSSGLLADPITLFRLLDAISHSLRVDETLSNGRLQQLGLDMRGLRTSTVLFLTPPVQGLERQGGQTVIRMNEAQSAELWDALEADTVGAYVQRYPASVLGAPR